MKEVQEFVWGEDAAPTEMKLFNLSGITIGEGICVHFPAEHRVMGRDIVPVLTLVVD
jgi:hypothetical protein